MEFNVTIGRVAIKLQAAKEEEDGILIGDKGNQQRWAEVVKMGEPYDLIGPQDYEVGDMVLVPNMGGKRIVFGDDVYMVFLQSEIDVYDKNEEQGISRF